MICLYCGKDAENYYTCPSCKRDLRTYKKIQISAALAYNEGLSKARVRNLSGAADDLAKSLKYDKYNTDARNLLGLVYYEMGEPLSAMEEWVISKNLMPENNIADKYLHEFQKDSSTMNRIDDTTKKYNLVISYIERGDYDLAKIQLKRLISQRPNMIRARSLLALLYINEKNLRLAKRELREALKIDIGNPTVNNYLKEVRSSLKNEKDHRRKKKEEENIAEDSSKMMYIMDYSKVSVVNVIIGIMIGLIVSVFLIFPAIRQNSNSNTVSALITANEDVRNNENDIFTMNQTIDTLRAELENYKGRPDVKKSYENLVACIMSVDEENMEEATEYYENITRDFLEEYGQLCYDSLSETVGEYALIQSYKAANQAFEEEDYNTSVVEYLSVIESVEDYDNGQALFRVAECYENIGDDNKANEYYKRVSELFEGKQLGKEAEQKLERETE